ncbi:MAG: hypothetical protein ABEK00_01100 [Candidatus Nanohaloarchaea archaeon]
MDRQPSDGLLTGEAELHRQIERLDQEDRDLETGNEKAARTFEQEPTEEEYNGEYLPETGEPEVPGPGTEADRVGFELGVFEEGEEQDPRVTGTLIEENFSDEYFEATYRFETEEDYTEETPLISHLETEDIETILEKGSEDLSVTVSKTDNGMLLTAQYNDPDSATQAVYTVNQAVETLDSITDQEPY